MSPTLHKDDIIIVKECDIDFLQKNDIITFNQIKFMGKCYLKCQN